jgi:hypothetical protein
LLDQHFLTAHFFHSAVARPTDVNGGFAIHTIIIKQIKIHPEIQKISFVDNIND